MAKFTILRRVDAWVDYSVEIEAENPIEASAVACQESDALPWKPVGVEEFWNARFVTLDEDGEEIPEAAIIRG